MLSQLTPNIIINRFAVTGTFSNGYVAGSQLGSINLGNVVPTSSGVFGTSSDSIDLLEFKINHHLVLGRELKHASQFNSMLQQDGIGPTELGNLTVRLAL
jgi:hypothetical protein